MSLIDSHLSFLRFINRRPATVRARADVLNAFSNYLQARPLPCATRSDVLGYLGRDHLEPASRSAYLSHLRGFYLWALDEHLVDADPTYRIPHPRVPKRVPRPFELDTVAFAVSCAPPRTKTWLLLMFLAGLRAMEVAGLRPDDVILAPTPILYLRERKGGDSGTVPAHPMVLDALAALPVRAGRWWNVSPRRVTVVVSEFLRSIEVEGTGHRFRHSAGTTWYEVSDHDVIAVQRLLGHALLTSTMIYVDVAPTRPAEVVAAVNL